MPQLINVNQIPLERSPANASSCSLVSRARAAGEGKILPVTKKDSWTMKQKTQTVSSRVFLRYRNSNISFLGLGAKGCWSSKNLTIAHLRLAPNFLSSVARDRPSGRVKN